MRMKVLSRVAALILICCMSAGLFAACSGSGADKAGTSKTESTAAQSTEAVVKDPVEGFNEIKLAVYTSTQTGSGSPTQDVLTPIWRAKTKVIPQITDVPDGTDMKQWVQMQSVAGTLPQILAGGGIDMHVRDLMIEGNYLRSISLEDIREYMPRYCAYLEKYGLPIDEVYKDNLNAKDGKLWYIPQGFEAADSPYLRNNQAVADRCLGWAPYWMYIRDDILKQIFPQAKNVAELKESFKQKGKLDWDEDILAGISIKTREDLYNYFVKVKGLNLKTADGAAVVPAHPTMNKDLHAAMWSAYTLGGFIWTGYDAAELCKGENVQFVFATPQWKEYMRWFNRLHTEGLLDKEHWIQDDNQRRSKVIQGRYATFQAWQDAEAARKEAKDKGWGFDYRLYPVLPLESMETELQDAQYTPYDYTNAGVYITTSVQDEELPQVYNYIDWCLSEEADELRYWGIPDFYTGEGKDRRFKPEYKDLEDWAVNGKNPEKGGPYYGMYDTQFRQRADRSLWNGETFGVAGTFNEFYGDQPYFTYPQSTVDVDNLDAEFYKAANKHYYKQMVYYRRSGWNQSDMQQFTEFIDQKAIAGWDNDAGKSLGLAAVIGKPEDFDKNWEKLEDTYSDEFWAAFKIKQDKWKEIFNNFEKPAREKALAEMGK